MSIFLHEGDLPDNVEFSGSIGVDTETTGLDFNYDRVCVVSIATESGDVHVVKIKGDCPNLKKVLEDETILKIMHFALFDIKMIFGSLHVFTKQVYCTKVVSRILRKYISDHSLKGLCKSLLNVDLPKEEQQSDWAANNLTEKQITYAANDVLFLHKLKEELDTVMVRDKKESFCSIALSLILNIALLQISGYNPSVIYNY